MALSSFDVPMMYGDHHVLEVRQLLSTLPGVQAIYASSSFQTVEVEFDENEVSHDAIREKLEAAGYLGELTLPVETGAAAHNGQGAFFRHTAVFAQTGQVISFAQVIPAVQRPLWPCPGIKP